MRIARFTDGNDPRYALVDGAGEKMAVLKGDPLFTKIELTGETLLVDDVRLLAPVLPRSKVVAVAKNYSEHAAEMGSEAPAEPLLFLKPNTSVCGPGDQIVWPDISERVDYEGELAVVIGRMCKQISVADALKVIYGYTIANDVTARDLQARDGQWARAKGFDTFCPLGPWIETELDPAEVRIRTWTDGELRQDGHSSMMIHSVAEIISYASQVFTLLPGDVILTGTPAGIGPIGSDVTVEIDAIGKLFNRCITEAQLAEETP